MKDNLHWRPRRAGDRILMGGMHRSVRKLYTAAKLPLGMRATLPLLCRGEEILWIPYVGVCDGLPATDEESGTLVALFDAEGIKDISDVKCITERE